MYSFFKLTPDVLIRRHGYDMLRLVEFVKFALRILENVFFWEVVLGIIPGQYSTILHSWGAHIISGSQAIVALFLYRRASRRCIAALNSVMQTHSEQEAYYPDYTTVLFSNIDDNIMTLDKAKRLKYLRTIFGNSVAEIRPVRNLEKLRKLIEARADAAGTLEAIYKDFFRLCKKEWMKQKWLVPECADSSASSEGSDRVTAFHLEYARQELEENDPGGELKPGLDGLTEQEYLREENFAFKAQWRYLFRREHRPQLPDGRDALFVFKHLVASYNQKIWRAQTALQRDAPEWKLADYPVLPAMFVSFTSPAAAQMASREAARHGWMADIPSPAEIDYLHLKDSIGRRRSLPSFLKSQEVMFTDFGTVSACLCILVSLFPVVGLKCYIEPFEPVLGMFLLLSVLYNIMPLPPWVALPIVMNTVDETYSPPSFSWGAAVYVQSLLLLSHQFLASETLREKSLVRREQVITRATYVSTALAFIIWPIVRKSFLNPFVSSVRQTWTWKSILDPLPACFEHFDIFADFDWLDVFVWPFFGIAIRLLTPDTTWQQYLRGEGAWVDPWWIAFMPRSLHWLPNQALHAILLFGFASLALCRPFTPFWLIPSMIVFLAVWARVWFQTASLKKYQLRRVGCINRLGNKLLFDFFLSGLYARHFFNIASLLRVSWPVTEKGHLISITQKAQFVYWVLLLSYQAFFHWRYSAHWAREEDLKPIPRKVGNLDTEVQKENLADYWSELAYEQPETAWPEPEIVLENDTLGFARDEAEHARSRFWPWLWVRVVDVALVIED